MAMRKLLELRLIKFMDIQMEEWLIHGQKSVEVRKSFKASSMKKCKIQTTVQLPLINRLNITWVNLLIN